MEPERRPNDEIVLDDGDADVVLAALNPYIAEQYRQARHFGDNRALADHYLALGRNAERIARYLEDELYPEPEPPDFDGDELVQIRRQTPVTA